MSDLNDLLVVMREHQKADRLIQGSWIENRDIKGIFTGCFYGCAMQTDKDPIEGACHKYGMPLWIGFWSERVFEWLPANEAVLWPVQLLEAMIDFTGDYEDLRHKLAIKRLSYLSERNTGDVKKSIDGVIKYHQTRDESIIKSARAAAWAAAESAEESAAQLAVCSAVCSVALSVSESAESAAGSEESEEPAWQRERDWMLELLKEQTR